MVQTGFEAQDPGSKVYALSRLLCLLGDYAERQEFSREGSSITRLVTSMYKKGQ